MKFFLFLTMLLSFNLNQLNCQLCFTSSECLLNKSILNCSKIDATYRSPPCLNFSGRNTFQKLILTRKNFKQLPANLFEGYEIKELYMFDNKIELIADSTFDKLSQTTLLDLSFNLIRTINSNFSKQSFHAKSTSFISNNRNNQMFNGIIF